MSGLGYRRTEEDFRRAAEVQLQAIQVSVRAFDDGLIGEAARIANAIFILVGRGMRNHTSIYDAAGQQDKRLYRSTISHAGGLGTQLICAELEKVGVDEWVIGLRHQGRDALESGRDLTFDDWWTEAVVNNNQLRLSRQEIVRIMRDKNGGAHFDTHVLDELVAAAIKGDIGAFTFRNSATGRVEVVPGGLEYTIRQIATELCYSLQSPNPQASLPAEPEMPEVSTLAENMAN